MRRALAGIVVFAAFGGDALAGERILLPSARAPLAPGPPVLGHGVTGETRFPGRVGNTERVHVGIDANGTPVSVAVLQRLELSRLGDYTFGVSGPIVDVFPAPGTDSQPGLRNDLVVWAGFSPGRKTLAARVLLRTRAAAPVLPLRIHRSGDVVRVENATGAHASNLAGPANVREVAAALDATREALARGAQVPDAYVAVPRLPRSVPETIVAPLAVSLDAGDVHVTRRLGDGGANAISVRVPAGTKLHIVARPVPPARLLAVPISRANALRAASLARLTVARELQYQAFLPNPDPFGPSAATYVYDTAAAIPAPRATPAHHGGRDWTPLVIALCVLGAAGLVVLWAYN